MLNIERRIKAFVELGKYLKLFAAPSNPVEQAASELYSKLGEKMEAAVRLSFHHNGWFTEANVRSALGALGASLEEPKLRQWLGNYPGLREEEGSLKRVGVIMAGNVPAVGFHDMLCVLISGNIFAGKLSGDDRLLLPLIAEALAEIEPAFAGRFSFTQERLPAIDAVIATGSNNSARYFEYYFGKYPHIIRKNRNSIAVLDGTETEDELRRLGHDIFGYYGLGCRSVSKIFVPEGFDLDRLFKAIYEFRWVLENNKYANNYDYNKTVYLLNGDSLIENGFIMLKEDIGIASPVATLYYEYYKDEEAIRERLRQDAASIQCVVSKRADVKNKVDFGKSQRPELWDYADGVDTLKFLLTLDKAYQSS